MHNSKKAQISDTMSWIVATIIIVLILSIPILLIELGGLNLNKFSFERVQDPIATKSISGYLLKNYDIILKKEINSGQVSASKIDASVYPFLLSLSRNKDVEGWNLAITLDKKDVYQNKTYSLGSLSSKQSLPSPILTNKFYFDESGKEVMLQFYREGQMYS